MAFTFASDPASGEVAKSTATAADSLNFPSINVTQQPFGMFDNVTVSNRCLGERTKNGMDKKQAHVIHHRSHRMKNDRKEVVRSGPSCDPRNHHPGNF